MTGTIWRRMLARMRSFAALGLVGLFIACTSGAPVPDSSPTAVATAARAPSPTASPTITPEPTLAPRQIPHVPALQPNPFLERAQITIDAEERPGQPWEATAFVVTRSTVDSAYRAQVAKAFAVSGDGFVGAAPDGTAPWRVWFDVKGIVAMNERTGDVLFLGPNTDDGTAPSGPAVHDPGQDQIKLLTRLGTVAQFDYTLLSEFHGGDTTASVEQVVDGSWLLPGTRTTVAFFPWYGTADRRNGTAIYATDELGLFTAGGQLAELVHRPIAGIAVQAVYDMSSTLPYGEAARELTAAPSRYLRLLSVPPTEAIKLHVDPANVAQGHAWAGARRALTHEDDTLVPVWVFYATGTTASGKPVSAIFTVDAIRPEYRVAPTSSALNLTADSLLRTQLAVLAGHRPGLMNAEEALRDELVGLACASGTYTLSKPDTDTAIASVTCPGGRAMSLTLRRAFPGLERSIWYLSETRK